MILRNEDLKKIYLVEYNCNGKIAFATKEDAIDFIRSSWDIDKYVNRESYESEESYQDSVRKINDAIAAEDFEYIGYYIYEIDYYRG